MVPLEPDRNDTAYSVSGLRKWYTTEATLGESLTTLKLGVTSKIQKPYLEIWIDENLSSLARVTENGYYVDLPLTGVTPGMHRLMLSDPGEERAFFRDSFTLSAPLFVLVSSDWDYPDNPDAALALQDSLHTRHPELTITQFVGPYLFTDPELTQDRKEKAVQWLLRAKSFYQDEIGLHIHAHRSFLEAAKVNCRSTPSWYWPEGDSSGYSLYLSSFSPEEMGRLLHTADSLFNAYGLPLPRSFRAGGWSADVPTVRLLARHGFRVDASAVNRQRLYEEICGLPLYGWLGSAWPAICDTSQPFMITDTLSGNLSKILEVPDNGALIQYVSPEEMHDIFRKNLGQRALTRPRQVSYVFHSENFCRDFLQNLNCVLDSADRHLLSRDAGPVVYSTMDKIHPVFAK